MPPQLGSSRSRARRHAPGHGLRAVHHPGLRAPIPPAAMDAAPRLPPLARPDGGHCRLGRGGRRWPACWLCSTSTPRPWSTACCSPRSRAGSRPRDAPSLFRKRSELRFLALCRTLEPFHVRKQRVEPAGRYRNIVERICHVRSNPLELSCSGRVRRPPERHASGTGSPCGMQPAPHPSASTFCRSISIGTSAPSCTKCQNVHPLQLGALCTAAPT